MVMAAIGWGVLEPRVVYPTRDLAVKYEASIPQVRLALTALTHDGLVVPVPGRGYRLTEPTSEELRELIEFRLLIEVPTARRAAEEGVSDKDLVLVRRLASATMPPSQSGDLIGYIRADLEFHLQLVSLGGSQQLVEVVRLLRARSRIPGIKPVADAFMVENAHEHIRMAEMLGNGDGPGLDDLLRRHICRVLD
jgi:DNA-binding GntR family transcriptional regulator